MYFFGLFVTFAGNVIAHQLLACPAQPKPPATMQKMRSTYMFPSPDHPVSFPRSPVSLPRSRPASYQIIHLLNGSVHLCSQFNGLLHRHVSSIYQFVHAHTLFTHLCHVGSSPGPGDILSIRRHSCTHIPFSHTCATWAPLQVLAIYSAAKGIRARTYPFHTLVPRGLLSRSWRYTQQPKAFVHAHTLSTHLCHAGSSPGPGEHGLCRPHSTPQGYLYLLQHKW